MEVDYFVDAYGSLSVGKKIQKENNLHDSRAIHYKNDKRHDLQKYRSISGTE